MPANSTDRPEPPVLKRHGFQLCGDILTVAGVGRQEGSRLRELFYPAESFRLKRDQKAAAEAAQALFRRPFFIAQLRHYGIKFPSSGSVQQLRELLAASVREGRCDRVPEAVVHLQEDMRRDHAPGYRKWEEEARAWDARKKQREDDEFEKLETPGRRAEFDLQRFMDHYFLTDGQPDPNKTLEPLALHGFLDRWKLHNLAEKIPGLHTASGGSDAERTVCVGWGRGAVLRLAGEMDRQAARAKERRREALWEQAMEDHRRFVAQKSPAKKAGRGRKKAAPPFDVEQCRGSYFMECKAATEGWDAAADQKLTLDIVVGQDGLLMARHDFGVIQGTMLLSLSEEKLEAEVRSRSDSGDEEEYSGDDDDDDEDPESDEEEETRKPGRKKRAAGGSATGPAKKKKKKKGMTPSLPRRVYFRLRGRETGEGEVLPTPQPGHLDFLDDGGLAFEGLAYELPYMGEDVEFRGWKVSDDPRRRPESWSAFSETAYERARVLRW